jgi:D-sedoheptulose 7-phosphate isomerase
MNRIQLEYIKQTSIESQKIRDEFIRECGEQLVEAARRLGECVARGGKLLIIGNGGSAADAQHMAAEMVGRMLVERKPLAAIALTTDSSNLTAIGNDYGYDQVFVRQIEALAKPEDVLLAISTSGNSKNVLLGVEAAKKKGTYVIGLTGGEGGKLGPVCDIWLNARAGKNSSRIQETHIFAVHSLVDLVDRFFLGD